MLSDFKSVSHQDPVLEGSASAEPDQSASSDQDVTASSDVQTQGASDEPNSKRDHEVGGSSSPKLASHETLLARPLPDEPSMTLAFLFYWVIPVLLLAIFSRRAVNTEIGTIPLEPQSNRPISQPSSAKSGPSALGSSPQGVPTPNSPPSAYSEYIEVLETIHRRRRQVDLSVAAGRDRQQKKEHLQQQKKDGSSKVGADSSFSEAGVKRGPSSDPRRIAFKEKIDDLKALYLEQPNDIYRAISYADAMRFYDVQYHDGGTFESEALEMYNKVVEMAEAERKRLLDQGEPTHVSLSGTRDVSEEVTLDYTAKSADGLLCAVYCGQGKVYFMANMFERSVDTYTKCLDLSPLYLDALNSRASSYIILGKFDEAGQDYSKVISRDSDGLFIDAFSGLARVLEAKEDAVPDGWTTMVNKLEELIPTYEERLASNPAATQVLAGALSRFHHALFTYDDAKTKNAEAAFRHLVESHKHKFLTIPKWERGSELSKVHQSMSIFRQGFWPPNVGSPTRVPVFIVGFVRSGSTLLERVLDSHPLIVGTGENSVFNGRLDHIRNEIVRVSMGSQTSSLSEVTRNLADEVVAEMRRRWEVLDANTDRASDEYRREDPQRFVDKMLTNYYNIGFIHLLYPNALILHVAREPMDTLLSAFKHEFPSGTLDYTSDFDSLAELYRAYRDIMDHWDRVLPGRVTHIRYEDMVHDMPRVAKAIIDATGLPWDESVLDFHKKKHAVNTFSTTQVRRPVYKDAVKSWMRYERQLQPLFQLLGDLSSYSLRTTLPNYEPLRHDEL